MTANNNHLSRKDEYRIVIGKTIIPTKNVCFLTYDQGNGEIGTPQEQAEEITSKLEAGLT